MLLRREARALRGQVLRPVLFGLAAALCGVGGAWFTARLLAALLGWPGAGWPELAAAAVLALGAAAHQKQSEQRRAQHRGRVR